MPTIAWRVLAVWLAGSFVASAAIINPAPGDVSSAGEHVEVVILTGPHMAHGMGKAGTGFRSSGDVNFAQFLLLDLVYGLPTAALFFAVVPWIKLLRVKLSLLN